MRGGGFLIAAFIFGLMAAATQASVAPPTHTPRVSERAEALPQVIENEISLMFIKEEEAVSVSEPTAAIEVPSPRRKPVLSNAERKRLWRLRLFDLESAETSGASSFRAGPRGTVSVGQN